MNRSRCFSPVLVAILTILSSCATVPEAELARSTPPVAREYTRDLPDVSFAQPTAATDGSAQSPAQLAEPVVHLRDSLSLARPESDGRSAVLIADLPAQPPSSSRLLDTSEVSHDVSHDEHGSAATLFEQGEEQLATTKPETAPVAEEPAIPGDDHETSTVASESAPELSSPRTSPQERPAPPVAASLPVTNSSISPVAPTVGTPESPVAERSSGPAIVNTVSRARETGGVEQATESAVRATDDTPVTVTTAAGEVEIVLPGAGWIYVGSEYAAGSVELVGKSRRNGDDLFVFELSAPGEYGLWFQQQNVATGSFDNKRISVLSTADPAGSLQRARAEGEPEGITADVSPDEESVVASGPDYSVAVGLLRAGDTEQAFRLMLDESAAFDPAVEQMDRAVLDEFASAAEFLPPPSQRRFWSRLARADGPLASRARRELLRSSVAGGNPEEITASADALVAAGEVEADELLAAAREVRGLGSDEPAARLVSHAVAAGLPAGYTETLDDESLFLIARQFEQIGPNRNLRESLRLYRLITERFPLSGYWEQSRQRAEYIERHYIDIR